MFFTLLTDWASTIPSNIRGWLPIRYVVCWTGKDQRNIYKCSNESIKTKQKDKNDKKKGTVTQSTCVNKVLPREVTQAVMVRATLVSRSRVRDVGKELPRVGPVVIVPFRVGGP